MRFSDLDVLGHVSNNIYGQYLELGRVEWFREIPGNRVAAVVASISIDYLGEIKMGDEVYVKTWCEKVGNKSIHLAQEVFANDRCVTRATVVQVGFDPETKQSAPLLPGWEPSAVDEEPSAVDEEPSAKATRVTGNKQ